jgi:hypothetical protein
MRHKKSAFSLAEDKRFSVPAIHMAGNEGFLFGNQAVLLEDPWFCATGIPRSCLYRRTGGAISFLGLKTSFLLKLNKNAFEQFFNLFSKKYLGYVKNRAALKMN